MVFYRNLGSGEKLNYSLCSNSGKVVYIQLMHLKDHVLPAEMTQMRHRWPPPRRNRTHMAGSEPLPTGRVLSGGSPNEGPLRLPLEALTWQGVSDGTTRNTRCHSSRWFRPQALLQLTPPTAFNPTASSQPSLSKAHTQASVLDPILIYLSLPGSNPFHLDFHLL